jgi:signal transduction histidine kinase
MRVEGDERPLPPTVDVSAYRIVQEALTNTLKHAGSSTARIRLRYVHDALEVEVTDSGVGDQSTDRGGHGLAGMRERVTLFGGELHVGTRPDGGYSVAARLPL